jgi:hypothetical protein
MCVCVGGVIIFDLCISMNVCLIENGENFVSDIKHRNLNIHRIQENWEAPPIFLAKIKGNLF